MRNEHKDLETPRQEAHRKILEECQEKQHNKIKEVIAPLKEALNPKDAIALELATIAAYNGGDFNKILNAATKGLNSGNKKSSSGYVRVSKKG